MTIGRILRERHMSAGIAKTVPDVCVGDGPLQACNAAKRSGETLKAVWRSVDAICASACVYALVGASERLVPPGSRLAVHSGRSICISRDGRIVDLGAAGSRCKNHDVQADGELRRYLREMGVGDGLFETIAQVPYESIRILNRDEIARFGIDRHEFEESRWTANLETNPTAISKYVSEAKGPGHDEFRASLFHFGCVNNGIVIFYLRGLPTGDKNAGTVIKFTAGEQSVTFPNRASMSQYDSLDRDRQVAIHVAQTSLAFVDAAVAGASIEVFESSQRSDIAAHLLHLSTAGLQSAWSAMWQRCAGGA
jgi:hypothetical protein